MSSMRGCASNAVIRNKRDTRAGSKTYSLGPQQPMVEFAERARRAVGRSLAVVTSDLALAWLSRSLFSSSSAHLESRAELKNLKLK